MLAIVAAPDTKEGFTFRDVPAPQPGPTEALVDVNAISLNRGEANRLSVAEPDWRPGWDFSGVVRRAARDGRGPAEGQRVVGIVPEGSWAQQVAVSTDRVATLPDQVSFADAATLPVAGLTALRTLRFGGLLLGRRAVITGAAGGVGRLAVQLASQAGAYVIAIVGSSERASGLDRLGAAETVLGIDRISEPAHLILESVGGESLAAALKLVAPHGCVVSFGNSSRQDTSFNVSEFYTHDDAQLRAFLLLDPDQAPFTDDLSALASLVAVRKLSPEIGLETSWRHLAEALKALRERKVNGKAVLTVA
ncbi:MAG: zinc-binding dehydrogenase [Chloroflexota bacterium]